MKKYILVLSLVMITLFATTAEAAEPSSWAKEEINKAVADGLIEESKFANYQENITREQFCELAVTAYEKLTDEVAVPAEDPFEDTDNQEVLKAYVLGIVNGVSETEFAPEKSITRQEICVMLRRTVLAAGVYRANLNEDATFSDSAEIADWANEAVQYMYSFKILNGVGDNYINPMGNTTCEQAVLLVVRTVDKFKVTALPKIEEEFNFSREITENIFRGMDEYVDENGYVDEESISAAYDVMKNNVSSLIEKGDINEAHFDDEHHNAMIVFDGGRKMLCVIPELGTNSGVNADEKFEILALNNQGLFDSAVFSFWGNLGNISFRMQTAAKGTYSSQYVDNTVSSNTEITVGSVMELLSDSNSRVILWDGHGHINESHGSYLVLMEKTSMEKDTMYFEENPDFFEEVISVRFPNKSNSYYALSAKFFDAHLAEREDGLFFTTACYSAENNSLSDIFIKKGFTSYIGSTGEIKTTYATSFMEKFTEFLCEKDHDKYITITADEAFVRTQSEKGAADRKGVGFRHVTAGEVPFRFLPSWKEAYALYLMELSEKYNNAQFDIAYVDDDDIPELVILWGSARMATSDLYTFVKNKVEQVKHEEGNSGYGPFGMFFYKERKGLVYVGHLNRGYETHLIYEVDRNKSKTKHSLYNNRGAVLNEDEVQYTDGGNEISKLEYEAKEVLYGMKNVRDTYKLIEYGHAQPMTKDNINRFFGTNY